MDKICKNCYFWRRCSENSTENIGQCSKLLKSGKVSVELALLVKNDEILNSIETYEDFGCLLFIPKGQPPILILNNGEKDIKEHENED